MVNQETKAEQDQKVFHSKTSHFTLNQVSNVFQAKPVQRVSKETGAKTVKLENKVLQCKEPWIGCLEGS